MNKPINWDNVRFITWGLNEMPDVERFVKAQAYYKKKNLPTHFMLADAACIEYQINVIVVYNEPLTPDEATEIYEEHYRNIYGPQE